jgi:Uncharacterized protein conserved in bacteria C-term(DUF2220)
MHHAPAGRPLFGRSASLVYRSSPKLLRWRLALFRPALIAGHFAGESVKDSKPWWERLYRAALGCRPTSDIGSRRRLRHRHRESDQLLAVQLGNRWKLSCFSDRWIPGTRRLSRWHLVRTAHLMGRTTPVYRWGDIDVGGLRIAAHLEDTFETAIGLHQMEHHLALTLGSPLPSSKGLVKLGNRPWQIGQFACWHRSGEARILKQEELDPKHQYSRHSCTINRSQAFRNSTFGPTTD